MGTVLCVWTQEEVRPVIQFLWAKGTAPIEIRHEIQAVYGSNVMTVQHVLNNLKFTLKHLKRSYMFRSYNHPQAAYFVPS